MSGRLKRFVRTYRGFATAGFQSSMAYRTSFLCYAAGETLYCFVMYFIWKAVFAASGEGQFMGFSMTDMTIYVFLSNIVRFLTATDSTQSLAEEIRDGSIVMRLIKPVSMDLSLLAKELGNTAVTFLFLFLPVMAGVEIYRLCALGYVAFRLDYFALFLLSCLLSYLLSFYLNLIFGYLAFFLMNIWGFSMLKESILGFFSGSLIPLAFFPEAFRRVLEELPFASLVYVPTMVYMGKYTGTELTVILLKQVVWIGVFVALSRLLWCWARKRLALQGG